MNTMNADSNPIDKKERKFFLQESSQKEIPIKRIELFLNIKLSTETLSQTRTIKLLYNII